MWTVIIMYVLLIPSIPLFLHYKKKLGSNSPLAVSLKAECTVLVAITAIIGTAISTEQASLFAILITSGLVLGLIGDVVICQKAEGGFLSGMVYFALGHLCYIAAFLYESKYAIWSIPIFIGIYLLLVFIARKIKLNLGNLMIPTIIYSAIITIMLSLAVVMPFSNECGFVILVGAILFSTSDGILAYGVFKNSKKAKLDSFGLYCYFIGQSLFAVSIYLMK